MTRYERARQGDSTLVESSQRQLSLWKMTLRARYAGIVAISAVAAFIPHHPYRGWIAPIMLAVLLPYNAAYDALMRRQGALSPALAFSDQVFAVAFVALAPELLAPTLMVMLAINATSAVAFGRTTSLEAAGIGALGASGVLWGASASPEWLLMLVYLVGSTFMITVVGGVAEVEREVRGRYVELMGGTDAVLWEQVTRSPTTLYVNDRAEELLGYPTSAWSRPRFWHDHVHPDDHDWVRARYREALKAGHNCEVEYRFIAADGRTVFLHDRMRVETDAGGTVLHVRGVMVDVTDRKLAEQQMDQYLNLVDRLELALFVFAVADPDDDPDHDRDAETDAPESTAEATLTVLALNPVGARLLDLSVGEVVGRRFEDVVSTVRVPDRRVMIDALLDVARTGTGFMFDDLRFDPADPDPTIFSANVFPLPGGTVGVSLQDVTERVMAAEGLRRQALHDGLTGLPNRTLLTDRLRHALQRSSHTQEPVALLIMDLDQFKEVNDALGHDHGDRLLIEMSRRLQRELADADTVARLGGDEFAVLLTEHGNLEGAQRTAAQISAALEQPFRLGGISLQVNASIGIAVYPEHAVDSETLARRADVAMYTAKRSGGGAAVYAPEHDQSSVRRLALLGELRRAIAEDELVLHYQPTVDLRTGAVCGCEALVRWQHPDYGLMAPGEFIELAEVSGLIQPLTRWVLETAIHQIGLWRPMGIELQVAVNLSVRNLYDHELAPWLSELLTTSGVEASKLTLEITESELMDDPLYAMEVLGKLKALGPSTSIDDFGTGYSSLSYLKNLPIDELKIDRSFVGSMVTDDSDLTIVRSTIDLSHNLGLDVVAEGVEDLATLERLAELGCDRAQGYYLSQPVPADEFIAWLAAREGRRYLLGTGTGSGDPRWQPI